MLWRSSCTWVVLWGLSGLLVLLSWSLHSFLLLWTLLNLLLFLFIFFSSIMMSFFTLRSLWVSHLKLQWKTIKFKFDTWNQQILSLLRFFFFLNNTLSINCPVNSEKMGDCVEKLPQFLPANYEPHYAHELPLVIKAWREASMKSQQMLKSSNVNRSTVIYSTTFTFFMRNKIQIWTSFLIKHLYSFKIK